MDLRVLRAVAAVDAVNVVALGVVSPPHGLAGLAGYAPALAATVLVHRRPDRRRAARLLCAAGLVPNTVLAVAAGRGGGRALLLSVHLGVGGALLGLGYLAALRRPEKAP